MGRKIVVTILLIIGAVIFIFPFLFMLLGSFKTNGEIFSMRILALPQAGFKLTYYVGLFGMSHFGASLLNSAIVSTCFIGLALFFSSLAGFAFAKHNFPGRNWLFVVLLASIMLPAQVTYVPLFILMAKLKWVSTYQALILPRLLQGFGLAFSIFLMRQYMSYVPDAILASARVDGCREYRIYWSIAPPHGKIWHSGRRHDRFHGYLERFHVAAYRGQQVGNVHRLPEHFATLRDAARGGVGQSWRPVHEFFAVHCHFSGFPKDFHFRRYAGAFK